MPNDYIKDLVLTEIINLKNNCNQSLKQRGINAEKAICKVNCFVCMDTRKLWAWRRDGFSTSIFSSHKYDLIKCNSCSDGSDIRTIDSPSGYEKNNRSDIDGRINDLIKIYDNKIKQEEERKRKQDEETKRKNKEKRQKSNQEAESRPFSVWGKGGYNSIDHNMKEKSIDVNVGAIADKVYQAVKAYHGDFGALANLAKNLTYQLKTSITNNKETKEIFDCTEPDEFGNKKYIVMKMEKIEENKTVTHMKVFSKTKVTSKLKLSYLILTPKNFKARYECDKFINQEVSNIIGTMKEHIKITS